MAREEYIRIYRSDVAGATPSLTSGEIAANLVDGKLFIGGTNGSLIQFTTDSYSVTGVNGLTGNVSLTGDGGAVQGKLNNRITARLTTAAGATGLASFRDTYFLVDATGHVQLAAAYQVTGQTVVAGYGIDLVSSGNTRTINNRGVTSFNGLTGNVSLTGDGGAVQGKLNNTITARLTTAAGATGLASFRDTYFLVDATGHVQLAAAYQVTGQTVVAGYGIDLVSSGNTRTINNRGVTSFNGLTGNVSLTGDGGAVQGKLNNTITVRVVADNAMTGIASFDADHFAVGSSGHVRSKGVMTINGVAPTNGNFEIAAATVVTGDGGAIQGRGNAFITARVATAAGATGLASFRDTHFLVDATGHVQLAAAYQVTGQTVVAGYGIDLVASGNTRTINNRGVTSFNGLTGNVSLTGDGGAVQGKLNNTITARLATAAGATGIASFRDTYFLVDATGHVQLASAYQVTGQTVVAGYGIDLVSSGNTRTINNRGVTSFNGLTGNVSLTGDGGAVQGKLNNTITARLTTAAGATGLASFRDTYFLVDATGHVQLASAYQVTGDTIVAGSAINFSQSGTTKTINNIGVTSFNGATGAINFTIPLAGATSGVTGTASFNANRFQVSVTGNVDLVAAYQVTGDTIVAGSAINFSQSGRTKTINNIGVTSFNGATGAINFTVPLAGATSGVTGTASFNSNRFQVSATGNVDLVAAYQATGDTVITVAGSGIGIVTNGRTDTLYNIGVTGIGFGNDVGLTGKINLTAGNNITLTQSGNTITINGVAQQITAVTGDGGAIIGRDNAYITARLATSSLTGVAAFNDTHFSINEETGYVSLLNAYDPTYVAFKNASNVFTSKQYFTAGISADSIYVGSGLTSIELAYRAVGDSFEDPTKYTVIKANDRNGMYLLSSNGGATASSILLTSGGIALGHNTQGGFATVTIGNAVVDELVSVAVSNYNSRIVMTAYDTFNGSGTFTLRTPTSLGSAVDLTLPNVSGTLALTRNLVSSFNGLTGIVSLTGDGGAIQGKLNNTITARVATDAVTGVASFNSTHFTVTDGQVSAKSVLINDGFGTNGYITLGNPTGTLTLTGSTIAVALQGANTISFENKGVHSFNGLTGNVSLTGDGGAVQGKLNNSITTRLTTAAGATGVASFRDTHFLVDATGHVQLASAYQVTGQTVVAGYGIDLVSSGNTRTINNRGVTSFNGLTGNVSLTGDGGAVQGKLNNTITTRLTTAAGATGLASFRDTHFLVDATGHVQLAAAYQVTGQTVVAGYGIDLVTSGNTRTINNRGVTSFNGLTGNVSLTGDGGAVQGKLNNTITVRVVADNAMTGIASFDADHFAVGSTGHVRSKGVMTINGVAPTNGNFEIAAATVVTGDGGAIQGRGNAFITARLTTAAGATGLASFRDTYFLVDATGHVQLAAAYQVTGDTIVAGSAINFSQSGRTKTINNIGVTSFNGATGAINFTIPLAGATSGVTGTASFNSNRFQVSATGNVDLVAAYQATGDTIVAGSAINFSQSGRTKTINNIGVTGIGFGNDVGLTGKINLTAGNNITLTQSGNTITINGVAQQITAVTGDGAAIIGRDNAFITARLTTAAGATGVASFRNTHFLVDGTGHVQLASAYQVTGDTIVAGSAINFSQSGTTKTINNIGVTSFNGATGAINFTVPLAGATSGVTGTASFNPNRFQVSATGNVDLVAAYQATGDTVITVAGSGIGIVTSGKTDTLYNIGVTGIGFGNDVGLTGKINVTAGSGITITRAGNTITIGGGGATVVTGDSGAIQGKLNTTITARHTTSVIVTNNGVPQGHPNQGTTLATYAGYGEEGNVHGQTGVGYFDIAHFVVKPEYGLVQLRNPAFAPDAPQFTGLNATGPSDGSLSYMYFDVGSLTFNSATTLDPNNDFVIFYDASESGLIKTKRMKSERILLDNDSVFNSKSTQFVKSKSSSNIEFEILTAPVTANETKLLKSGDAFTYISQNTVKSLNGATGDVTVVGNINGCTGAIVITGTTNQVVVSNSCPNITIGLPDNVSIPYLSGTGATFTQTVTANRFIGTVSGGDF